MNGDDVQDDAVGWFNLRRSGDMTDAEASAFDRWVHASPAARSAYDRLERHWDMLGALEHDPEIVASRERDARLYGRSRARHVSMIGFFTAAAAILLLVLLNRATFDPGLYGGFATSAVGAKTFQTGPSQHATVTLADGSVVTLDANTALRVVEMGARRRIQLAAGHAFFRVAKDAKRPFLVTAIDKTVHAIGTAFDVRITGKTVTVTLVEGKVRVDQPGGFLRRPRSTEMTPGRQLVAANDSKWTMSSVDTAQEMNWLDGRLPFLRDPLAKVVADVNKTSVKKIVFVRGAVPETKIVGVFRAGDVDGLATALQMNNIAHIVSETDNRIEMTAN